MKVHGTRLATVSLALVTASAIATAPTIQVPPRPVAAAVDFVTATSPRLTLPVVELTQPLADSVVQPPESESNALGALFSLDLGRFIIPPSAGRPFPAPPQVPGPSPAPTAFEFEDAIINTYHAIEPWVRYGFRLATYAVGWVPYVGWLSGQIMIFYNFGERIVESLVVNSANWLWGPLPFFEGLGNIAEDSWNALLQLGRDEWNFWLPPLPPLPGDARESQTQLASAQTLMPADQPAVSPTATPDPLRDDVVVDHRLLAGVDPVGPPEGVVLQEENVVLQEEAASQEDVVPPAAETPLADVPGVGDPASPGEDVDGQTDLPPADATPMNSVEMQTDPPEDTPNLSDETPRASNPNLESLEKPKPFAKKPAAEASDSPALPSRATDAASNESLGTAKDSVGESHSPKSRVKEPNDDRVAGSPSGDTASSQDPS